MVANYYQVLGIPKSARPEEIRRAYRVLALRYHPDKNKDADAEERFKEITEAYEVLNDKEKRQKYNKYGSENRIKKEMHPSHASFNSWAFPSSHPFDLFQSSFGHPDLFFSSNFDPLLTMIRRHARMHQYFHNNVHHSPLHHLTDIFHNDKLFRPSLGQPSQSRHRPPPRPGGVVRNIEIVIEQVKDKEDAPDKKEENFINGNKQPIRRRL